MNKRMYGISAIILLLMNIGLYCQPMKGVETISVPSSNKDSLFSLGFTPTVIFSFPQISNSAQAIIRIGGRDSLSMVAIGPFGMTVGKLFANKTSFTIYDIFHDVVYEGSPDSVNESDLKDIPFNFKGIINLFRCEPPGNLSDYSYQMSDSASGNLIFRNKADTTAAEFIVISPENKSMVQYQRKSIEGTLLTNIFFSDFAEFSGYLLPKKITITLPKWEGRIDMETDDFDINKPIDKPFSFKAPDSAKRKTFGKQHSFDK
ncbi:MAG: hypothetical protein QG635_954 [Bacteroidota bacterium]|nr:hypothetical protein [Bacteroidota bacterium]